MVRVLCNSRLITVELDIKHVHQGIQGGGGTWIHTLGRSSTNFESVEISLKVPKRIIDFPSLGILGNTSSSVVVRLCSNRACLKSFLSSFLYYSRTNRSYRTVPGIFKRYLPPGRIKGPRKHHWSGKARKIRLNTFNFFSPFHGHTLCNNNTKEEF